MRALGALPILLALPAQVLAQAVSAPPQAAPLSPEKIRRAYEVFVDPGEPNTYRLTGCGRFAVPLGMLLLSSTARSLGAGEVTGHPVACATSVGSPELPVSDVGLGPTAPANLYHFVGYPAAAFTIP